MNDRGRIGGLSTFREILVIVTMMLVASCAAEGPQRPADLITKIENARTAKDHEQLAATYERQSTLDQAAAEQHQARAQNYRALRGGRLGSTYVAMAQHCENLASQYRQAAGENAELASLHRKMAASTEK